MRLSLNLLCHRKKVDFGRKWGGGEFFLSGCGLIWSIWWKRGGGGGGTKPKFFSGVIPEDACQI